VLSSCRHDLNGEGAASQTRRSPTPASTPAPHGEPSVKEQDALVSEGCSMYPELAGDQHPSAQTDHRQAEQRERQTDPADLAPDARIIPRVRFGVDPEDSLKPHPNCLSSSAVSRG